eukprot:CAMPEP_0170571766 /NCGR_PEP_ID=MMETSP0224-20130122/1860_1 /TAXON_ID=285029 /ORGANISM="Togula jolla, Strain CCCM 725" /LENGTH=86 /DNA_ID=CAMNT_0010894215 /DNA_START=943 /DNA_END=1204 /DNA_ORIENTATION=-
MTWALYFLDLVIPWLTSGNLNCRDCCQNQLRTGRGAPWVPEWMQLGDANGCLHRVLAVAPPLPEPDDLDLTARAVEDEAVGLGPPM